METDWHIGRLLETLDRLGIDDQTMIVFSRTMVQKPLGRKEPPSLVIKAIFIFVKGRDPFTKGGHRVPFFVRWPGHVRSGGVSSRTICQTDLLATLAELVGANVPDHAGEDSVSFLAELLPPKKAAEGVSKYRLPVVHHSSGGGFAIRDRQWKLIMPHRRQKLELYDLSLDPSEQKDLSEAFSRCGESSDSGSDRNCEQGTDHRGHAPSKRSIMVGRFNLDGTSSLEVIPSQCGRRKSNAAGDSSISRVGTKPLFGR